MKKLLFILSLSFYLIVCVETSRKHYEEFHIHDMRREDVEKIIGSYDYLNGLEEGLV